MRSIICIPLFTVVVSSAFAEGEGLTVNSAAPIQLQESATTNSDQPNQSVETAPPQENARTEYEQGLAEFNSGKIEFSIFAFERALIIAPEFHDARLAITRAYIAVGEYVAASTQLAVLEKHNQTLTAKQFSEAGLLYQQVRVGMNKGRSKLQGSISIGLGQDSNVNAGPDITSITLPNAAPVNLNAGALSVDDTFAEFNGYFQYTRLTGADNVLFAGAGLDNRSYSKQGDYDALALRGYGGVIFQSGSDQYKLSLMMQQYSVDGAGAASGDQQQIGLQGSWKHRLTAPSSVNCFMQLASISYSDQATRDVNQVVIGAGWESALVQTMKYSLSIYTAVDSEVESGFEEVGRNFSGIQLTSDSKTGERSSLYASVNVQASSYGADDLVFQETRDETFMHVVMGWSRLLGDSWVLQPEIRYSSNSSNIPLYEFDRSQLMLMAKRSFK